MFFVYILKSLKDKNLYIGYTNDLKRKFKEHNSGLNKSTRNRGPFRLVYYESFSSKDDAKQREENLKLYGRARIQLFERIKKSLAS